MSPRLMSPGLRLHGQHLVYCRKHLPPIALLLRELGAAGPCQGVESGPAPVFEFPPFPRNPTFLRQPVQGGEEGTGAHHENPMRYLLDAVRNADPVQWSKLDRSENEEIQSSLQKFGGLRHWVNHIG